jgi:hypothetical protein
MIMFIMRFVPKRKKIVPKEGDRGELYVSEEDLYATSHSMPVMTVWKHIEMLPENPT